jgi:NAD(P)-dependent dehydrogenase (short-subunit alcohol dehydrogenase family)
MEQLSERVAVVTGAANGIGFATSEALAAEGMRVVLADIDPLGLDEAVEGLRATGAEVEGVVVDVRDQSSVEALAAAAIDRFGAINVAVNNAGIVNRGFSWELSLEDWERVIAVDLWGVIHGVRSFVPRLLATGEEGHVVNVSSLAAVTALTRLAPYTVAKHGVLGLSDVLRAELEELGAPIGVSVVMPGMTKTKMVPIGTTPASVVAANVIDAIRRRRRYVYSDQESASEVAARLGAIVDARREVLGPEGFDAG